MIKIKVVNRGHQQLPAYATPQSAGMDLRANLSEPVTLHPMERRLIPTGLHIALPEGYEAQVRPRSGLALKHGLTVLNTPGTIDADYRGEIGVVLINLSQEDFVINDGERIAQMVIARHEQGDLVVVEELDQTERGEGGYGQFLQKEKSEFIMSKQFLRSGTSIGANIHEGVYAQSKADFVSKLSISLKEANETSYWLILLKKTDYLTLETYNSLKSDLDELIRMIISSLKTAKKE